jgi:two-component system cell cycle sensor histidine kinase PleC
VRSVESPKGPGDLAAMKKTGKKAAKAGGRRDRPNPTSKTAQPLSGQARTVLALVMLFTVAFVTVIALKISHEWRFAKAEGETRQARAAVFLAERAAARLDRIQTALAAAGAALEVDLADGDAADLEAHLVAVAAREDVLNVALINAEGGVAAALDADAGAALARAARNRSADLVWTASAADTTSIYVAAPMRFGDEVGYLVARANPFAVLPGVSNVHIAALVTGDGRVMAAGGAEDAPPAGTSAPEAFRISAVLAGDAVEAGGGAIGDARITGAERGVLGVAPVPRSDLAIYLAGPLVINDQQWRRTLLFYLLLLIAPILVAGGLCAVLLMQMENIRQARAALSDSEKRFRLAIEGARCGVWDWDVANDTVYMTDSLARMLGRRAAATLSGDEFLALVRHEDQDKLKLAIRGAPGSGEVDVEFRANGLPVWLHARGRPWTGADGRPSGRVVGVAIDVTEQKGAQARVAAAETRLRAALESMSESFALWDARRRLVLSNGKYRDFFHLDAKLVKPGAAYEMLDLAAQGAIKTMHEGVEEGASELELVDGRWIHLSERRTADGGLVSIGTDITPLKRQEGQLVENEKRLRQMVADLRKSQERIADLARKYEQEKIRAEDANRSKSEFLANMSHELRTPLNAINGFSEIMQQEMFGPLGDQRYKEYVTDILASGQHLLALINDILDMSKIEAGKLKLSPEALAPDELAEQCARLMRGKAKEAGLDLVLEADDLPTIEADPRAIKQVLLNLLSNAVKFTPEGGQVLLRGVKAGDGVDFQVKDSGIGISKDDLPRLGRPFEQIESQQSKSHQGSGLGLALSKSLVEMHGGTLTIESLEGQGTTVAFHLPAKPRPAAAGPEEFAFAGAAETLAATKSGTIEDGETEQTAAADPETQDA